jgi:hypothetical protein
MALLLHCTIDNSACFADATKYSKPVLCEILTLPYCTVLRQHCYYTAMNRTTAQLTLSTPSTALLAV